MNETYNKIVEKEILHVNGKPLLLVKLENSNLQIGEHCKDFSGNIFTVKSVAHYKFTSNTPDWYISSPQFQLEGNVMPEGDYLIKL